VGRQIARLLKLRGSRAGGRRRRLRIRPGRRSPASSMTWKMTLPNATRVPGEATPSLIRTPLMKVPLVEPRSRTRSPAAAASTSPWWRDTVRSRIGSRTPTSDPPPACVPPHRDCLAAVGSDQLQAQAQSRSPCRMARQASSRKEITGTPKGCHRTASAATSGPSLSNAPAAEAFPGLIAARVGRARVRRQELETGRPVPARRSLRSPTSQRSCRG